MGGILAHLDHITPLDMYGALAENHPAFHLQSCLRACRQGSALPEVDVASNVEVEPDAVQSLQLDHPPVGDARRSGPHLSPGCRLDLRRPIHHCLVWVRLLLLLPASRLGWKHSLLRLTLNRDDVATLIQHAGHCPIAGSTLQGDHVLGTKCFAGSSHKGDSHSGLRQSDGLRRSQLGDPNPVPMRYRFPRHFTSNRPRAAPGQPAQPDYGQLIGRGMVRCAAIWSLTLARSGMGS